MNEEVSSDSESESVAPRRTEEEEEEELEETAQEKKLRLAKLYLDQLRQQEEEKAEAREFEEDQVAGRLKEDVLEQRGRLQKTVAKEIQAPDPGDIRILRGHQLPITCLVITPDDLAIFSAAKDCTIIKWSVESGRKLHVIPRAKKDVEGQPPGHRSHVLCMAISSDGKYLASGDRSKLILIWEAQNCRHLYTFTGHRDAVSGLAFRRGTHQLYSTSHDRSVKVWNVAENSYVETLFGHQDAVAAMDALSRECCVTAGGRDGTVRVWKIPEESQLVFYGHQGSIDCIQLINEEHMVSGADDGSVAVWGLSKKRPLALQREAHGLRGEEGLEQPYWVSSVAALLNTDLVATAPVCASGSVARASGSWITSVTSPWWALSIASSSPALGTSWWPGSGRSTGLADGGGSKRPGTPSASSRSAGPPSRQLRAPDTRLLYLSPSWVIPCHCSKSLLTGACLLEFLSRKGGGCKAWIGKSLGRE
ncbi:U3 small nucleolar RNA-interacting protein 2 isoform X3 [Erinaceus europaeus]|nr:U3 small nucleolar RNA-interacting protein 2 isoform X3 [Erinaceus europaeus]